MPHYYFNVRSDDWVPDRTGHELADDAAARSFAERLGRALLARGPACFHNGTIVVTDRDGQSVLQVPVK